MAAENQHYVSQFTLRQFALPERESRVAVYDKLEDRTFVTGARNIMAERRYNDFVVEDHIVSFEGIAGGIEDQFLPTYRDVLENRRLRGTTEEKVALATHIAFQMFRVRAQRDLYKILEESVRDRVEAIGGRMEDLPGWDRRKPRSL